jgi:hypothetical protein
MQQAKSMTGDYYCSLLAKLRTKIVETRVGKLSQGVLFCKTIQLLVAPPKVQ